MSQEAETERATVKASNWTLGSPWKMAEVCAAHVVSSNTRLDLSRSAHDDTVLDRVSDACTDCDCASKLHDGSCQACLTERQGL